MNAIQNYRPGEEFRLSSVSQLTAFDRAEYSWEGRTLTSWSNDLCGTLPLDAVVGLPAGRHGVSANWRLDRHPVTAAIVKDYGPGSGMAVVVMSCDEPPLPAPVVSAAELRDGQSTQVIYNSLISVDLLPDRGYKASKLVVNGASFDPSQQWTYGGKTSNRSFSIEAGFVVDEETAGISVYAAPGVVVENNPQVVSLSAFPDHVLVYGDGMRTVEPLRSYGGYSDFNSVSAVEDEYGFIRAIGRNAFLYCNRLSSLKCPGILSIDSYGMCKTSISAIDLPLLSSVGSHAFSNCDFIERVQLENVLSIGDNSFDNCNALREVEFPAALSIGVQAFQNNQELSSVSFPRVRFIGGQAFLNCASLRSVSMPEATELAGNQNFSGCSSLSAVYMPAVSQFGYTDTFRDCKSLVVASFPSLLTCYTNAFNGCTGLVQAYLPKLYKCGQSLFYGCKNLISIDLPSLSSGNTNDFQGCSNLSLASMPEITSVWGNMFENCQNLVSAYLPKAKSVGVNAFNNCRNLVSIDLPSVKSLDQDSFVSCLSLSSVNLPRLSAINANYSFRRCDSLVSVLVDNDRWYSVGNGYGEADQLIIDRKTGAAVYGVHGMIELSNDQTTKISEGAFSYHMRLRSVAAPEAVVVEEKAFEGCPVLSAVYLPGVRSIGANAFRYCSGLSQAEFGMVSSVGTNAFNGCALPSVDMPYLTKIPENSFYGFTGLVSANVPNVTVVAQWGFYQCSSLLSIALPNAVKIGNGAFYHCSSLVSAYCPNVTNFDSGNHTFAGCSSLVAADFPSLSSFSGIDNFENCSSLTSAYFPELISVSTYGNDGTFFNCVHLSSVYVPKLKNVCGNMFRCCTSLRSIELPNVNSIENYAFESCTGLSSIILSVNENVPTTKTNIFSNIGHAVSVCIPYGMSAEYMAETGWKSMVNAGKAALVEPYNLSDATMDIARKWENDRWTDWTYTGEPITPNVKLITASGDVVPRDAYYVTYYGNLNAGTIPVVAEAKPGSGYVGSKSGSFEIKPVDISETEPAIQEQDA